MDIIIIILLLVNLGIIVFTILVFIKDFMKFQIKVDDLIKNESIKSKLDLYFKEEKASIRKILVSFIYILLVVLFIIVATSIVWIPILIWFHFGFHSAYFSIAILFIALTLLVFMLLVKSKHNKFIVTEGLVIKEVIIVTSIVYSVILVTFGFDFTLYHVMEEVYLKASFFRNTFTILVPILAVSSVIANLYLIINGVIDFVTTKTVDSIWRTKVIDLILIVIVASFLGILFITETNFIFITEAELPSFIETLSVFKILLSSILIPIVFRKLYMNQLAALSESK